MDDGSWRKPIFNASDYIYQQGTLTYENLYLDMYGDAGNPRPIDHRHVQELATALLANPPKDITLTTWENRGMPCISMHGSINSVYVLCSF